MADVTGPRAAAPIVLAALLLAGCSGSSPPAPTTAVGSSPPPTTVPPSASGAASTGEATAQPASGSCGNVYQPVAEGDAWTYAVHGTGGEGGYTDTVTTVTSSSFTMTSDFGRVEKHTRWSCEPAGLVALQYGGGASGSLTAQDLAASFRTTRVTGVTIPRSIEPGDSWAQSYDLRGTIDLGGARAMVSGSVVERFTAGDVASVTVQAGTFDAIAVDTDVTLDLRTTVAGAQAPVRLSFAGTTDLARGVGMVKSTSATALLGQGMSTTIELTRYSVG